MLVVDHFTGNAHFFSIEKSDNNKKLPTLGLTTSQFHAATFDTACYVKITDGGVVTINPDVLSRMPVEEIVTIRHSGALAISGAVSPEETYEECSEGYRELSIYKDDDGEVTITVYEKPLNYHGNRPDPPLPGLEVLNPTFPPRL